MAGSAHAGLTTVAQLMLLLALFGVTSSIQPAEAAQQSGPGCGKGHVGEAKRNPNPRGLPPLLVGDSTIVLPLSAVTKLGFDVNAKGCRTFRGAVAVARKLRKRHELPHLILINAYAIGGVTPDAIEFALRVLGGRRVLGLITAYNAETGAAPAPDTDVLAAAAEQFPTRIVLLDWVQHSLPHHHPNDWFLPDLSHLNPAGAKAYARFLRRALPLAQDGRFPS